MDEQILSALWTVENQLTQALSILRELASMHGDALAGSVEEANMKNAVMRGG